MNQEEKAFFSGWMSSLFTFLKSKLSTILSTAQKDAEKALDDAEKKVDDTIK